MAQNLTLQTAAKHIRNRIYFKFKLESLYSNTTSQAKIFKFV